MPIDQSRMLALITAGEDLLAALGAAEEVVRRERALAREGRISAEEALENIGLFVQASLLLKEPLKTPLAITRERMHFSPMRLGANRRARSRAERHKAKVTLASPQESDDD